MQLIEAWMFVIIMSREILITSLRLFALNKGKVLSASRAGKHKTLSQMVVIFLYLVCGFKRSNDYFFYLLTKDGKIVRRK
jgi:phosphatidylglycerophosphate synthase